MHQLRREHRFISHQNYVQALIVVQRHSLSQTEAQSLGLGLLFAHTTRVLKFLYESGLTTSRKGSIIYSKSNNENIIGVEPHHHPPGHEVANASMHLCLKYSPKLGCNAALPKVTAKP